MSGNAVLLDRQTFLLLKLVLNVLSCVLRRIGTRGSLFSGNLQVDI